jgi:methyl-accepting chemotaxis protein
VSSSVIKEFLVSLNFDVDKAGVSNFSSSIATASVQAAAMGAAVLGAAAAITSFVTGIASELDVVGDLAERTENAASEIDKMGYIAELTDSSINAVNTSLEALNKNAGDTSLGIGRAKKVFEEIGVEVTDSNGKLKNSVALMKEVAGAIKDMDKGKQQAVLERLGIDKTLLKMLTQDVSALEKSYEELDKAAGFSYDQAVKDAGELEDSQIKLGLTMKRLKQAIAVGFIKGVAKSFQTFNDLLIKSMPAIIRAITPVITVIMKLADLFIFLGSQVLQAVGWILNGIMDLNDATNGWLGYITGIIVAWKLLNATFLASPIGIILALAAALVLLYDDFQTFKEGGESLIDWGKWKEEIDIVTGIVDAFSANLNAKFQSFFATIDALSKLLRGDFVGAWRAAGIAVEDFGIKSLTALTPLGFLNGVVDSVMAPSPAQGAGMTGGGANVNQQTTINVNGGDPAATGRAVAGEQSRVNGDMARNMKGAIK